MWRAQSQLRNEGGCSRSCVFSGACRAPPGPGAPAAWPGLSATPYPVWVQFSLDQWLFAVHPLSIRIVDLLPAVSSSPVYLLLPNLTTYRFSLPVLTGV